MFQSLKSGMRNFKRGDLKAVTAAVLFSAIIVVFVFWGMNRAGQGGVGQGGAAAEVNDSMISVAQYMEAMENMRRDPRFEQLQALGGDAGRQILQQQAVSQLVEMELIRQETNRQKLWTTDAEVRDLILSIPSFQENGQFRRDLYFGYLQSTGKTASEFEEQIRRQQSLSRAVRLFGSALKPLPIEAAKTKELSAQRANLEYAAVPVETLVMPETIKPAEVKAFLADPANDAKVKDYFTSHKADFSTPERVKVRHILVRAKPGDADSEKKALEKIEALANRAKTEDFGKLAAKESEDPGSKAQNGVIDFFSRGKMVPEFEEVAFSAPPNEISKPVKTQFGYHLIQVLEKRPATDRSIDNVREQIAATLIARDQSRKAIEALQETLKKGDEAAIRKFIADHKLKWEETGTFSIESDNIPKIGPNDEILRTAFTLSPEKPIASNFVRQGATGYILKYKPAPAGKADDKTGDKADMMAEMAAGRRGEDALRQWVETLRKNASITINPSIMSGGSPNAGSPSSFDD